MATTFKISHAWTVPRSVVLAHHMDAALHERANDAMTGVERRRIGVEERDGKTVQRFEVRGTEVPAAAQKVLKPEMLQWVEESVWDPATERFTWRILPNALKGKIDAGGVLYYETAGDTTRRVVEGRIEIRIPLAGKVVERVIVGQLERTYDQSAGAEAAYYRSVQ